MAIPFLDTLRSQIRALTLGEPAAPSRHGEFSASLLARERVLNLELEQLPYNLGAAHTALLRVEQEIRNLAASTAASMPTKEGGVIGVLSSAQLPLCWSVDSFLDSARRAQNAVTRYIARTFRTSVPQSLHAFVQNLDRHRQVSAAVRELVTGYWRSSGATLKNYRDLAQHHAVVSSDVWVHVTPGALPRVHLLLPSDSTNTSLARIAYEAPLVHAGDYCRSAFLDLFTFCYRLAYLLLRHTGSSQRVVQSLLRQPFGFRGGGSFSELPPADLAERLWAVRDTSFDELRTRFGGPEDPPLTTAKDGTDGRGTSGDQ